MLIAAQEFFRRYPRITMVSFIVIPILLIPYWRLGGVEDWFLWVKGFSVMASIVLIVLFRITRLGNVKLGQQLIHLFLVINIIEAITKDIVVGNIANYFNAMAGILVITTLNRFNIAHIDTKGEYKDIRWGGMTLMWIVGYTLWNWVFVYLNFSQGSIHHLAVLLAALVIALVDKERWLQTRAVTLGTYFILSISILHSDVEFFNYPYNESFGLIIAAVALGFMSIYALFAMSDRARS